MKKSTKIALASAGALTAANCIHAAFHKPKTVEKIQLADEYVDENRAAENLSRAIRIETVSDFDQDLVDWSKFYDFHKFLDEAYPLIAANLEKEVVGKANLLYRWKGSNPDLDPMALLSHMDVVPVPESTYDDWTHPPFSGYNDGAYIWGRGAMDMKDHLICVMEAVETLLSEGFTPERDVYLCFGQDEEVVASATGGAKEIAELLQSRGIHLDSVIDEGGAVLPLDIKGVFSGYTAGIGIAEKGYADYEITVTSKGGHSSQPPKHSGLGELAKVIADLENHQFKYEMPPFLTELFDTVGRACKYPARLLTCNLKLLKPVILEVVKHIPPAASLTHTTTGVTMAKGSPQANVLPQKSSIVVNFRAMPGVSTDDIEKHIRKVVRNKNIDVKLIKAKDASAWSPTDSRAYKAIEQILISSHPGTVVAPFLVMGGTDAFFYEIVCDNVYRFSPFFADVKLLLCTHGTDERVPLSALGDAVAFFKRYIRIAGAE